MLESAALLVEAVVGLIHQPVCKSSRVGSAETSSVSSSTSSRVGAVPDMIGGSGSSKGGRGLGGSSRNGVEKRIRRKQEEYWSTIIIEHFSLHHEGSCPWSGTSGHV